ncbi:acyltransferase [Pseudomonas sp. Irchel s3f10]|nr:acyltransferase [Pseudomonas sp. Irchel s3f10]
MWPLFLWLRRKPSDTIRRLKYGLDAKMLGIYRFGLAALVVVAHLTEGRLFFEHWGIFAVFGFYLISGYLMTIVLNEAYSFNLPSFAKNRFLRLFPIYYVAAIITIIAMVVIPGAQEYHNAWTFTGRAIDVVGNLFIFPFEFYDASFRLIPPAWSVGVELINYFVLWLFVARSKKLAVITVFATLIYHAATFAMDMDWTKRYFPFYAALLPFSMGACIYFFRDLAKKITPAMLHAIAGASVLTGTANLIACGLFSGLAFKSFNLFFYVNLICMASFIYCVANSSLQKTFKRSGKLLGDLAYPMFLLHRVVGFIMSYLVLDGQRRGLSLVAVSIIPILLLSYGLAWSANKWLEPVRNVIRRQAKTANPSSSAEAV